METYEKKGYLYSDFRLFYLTDTASREFEYHYHDFDKITIFLKGNVQYTIEGKSYQLQPYDIVLVSHNDIHKLNVQDSEPYERIVAYIAPEFISTYRKIMISANAFKRQKKSTPTSCGHTPTRKIRWCARWTI